ncbi:MAG: hypothetical protein OXF56_07920 [Rhodobacteraceae bacterium]|nr:hypothetical protein [Paracoccaceae bacterium]
MKTKFSNALAMLAVNLEMILKHTIALADTIGRMAEAILKVRAQLQLELSVPCRSRKSVGKWERRRHKTA